MQEYRNNMKDLDKEEKIIWDEGYVQGCKEIEAIVKNNVEKELDSLEIRTLLYCLTDKVIINHRANDRGDITPQQRDEMNMRLFNKFRADLLQILIK